MKRGVITNAAEWRSRKLQGKCTFQGLPISIENERGTYRQGTDEHGNVWRSFMHIAYGYVRATEGVDGDHVDVYIGPNKFATKVYVIHQNDPYTRSYDEDKCMLGFNSAAEAKAAYLRQYDRPDYFGTMTIVDMAQFKDMLKNRRGLKLKKSLEKAKRMPIGSVSHGRRKVAEGKWVPVKNEETPIGTIVDRQGDRWAIRTPQGLKVMTTEELKTAVAEAGGIDVSQESAIDDFVSSFDSAKRGRMKKFLLEGKATRWNGKVYRPKEFADALISAGYTSLRKLEDEWHLQSGNQLIKIPSMLKEYAEYKLLGKAKYIRRWRGREGKWNYQYARDAGEHTGRREEDTGQLMLSLPVMPPKEADKLLKQYRRRSPGDGKEKTIEKPEHLDAILRRSTFCMMSAGRNPEDPEDMKLTDGQIKARYSALLDDLREKGYLFTRCRGKYVHAEESVMVMCHDADKSDMMELGSKYKQDSIVFSEKGHGSLIYTTGENAGQELMEGNGYEVVPTANDFYTKMPLGVGGYVKFTISLEEIIKSLLSKSKYTRKYYKNGKWNYEYPKHGGSGPRKIGDYAELRNLGGTTGGAMHVRMSDGSEKVMKRSTSPAHLRDEYTANRIYKVLGVPVPDVKLSHDKEGNLVQVADYVKGVPLSELSGDDREQATNDIRRGFVADALLGNWDVLGLEDDNILWDGSKAWRIDNGGSLRYRAQGQPKGDRFGPEVGEVDSMRERSSSRVFGVVSLDEIKDQAQNVVSKRETILAGVQDPKLRRTLEQRINYLEDKYVTPSYKKSLPFPEGSLFKSDQGGWYAMLEGKPRAFVWYVLEKASNGKRYYSAEEIKARGMRWVTIRGARVLLQGTSDGGWVVVGGAGGKLNHLKVDRIAGQEEYQARRKQIETKRKEETKKLTKEEIAEAAKQRKAQVQARKQARTEYTEAVTNILGITPEEIRANITSKDMDALESKARMMVERRKAAKTMNDKTIEKEIEKQTEVEVQKAVNKQVKNVERAALETLMNDYMPTDPNAKSELGKLLDKDKALEVLAARKQFRKAIKEIGKGTADIPSDLKVGAIIAGATNSEIADIQEYVKDQIETAKNIEMYDILNAQSLSINSHVDQGAISALNGLIGDVYGVGATFGTDTIKELGMEAVVRAVTIKLQQDGKGEIVRKALEEYTSKERLRTVETALAETRKRLANADDLRELARDKDDAEAILSMASANGHALKQITAAQRALGTAVGSLRAAAHMINALEDPPADVVQVDMGKDLARARKRAKAAGLKKGDYQIRTVKRGKGKRLVLEIPKESLNSFFQSSIANADSNDRISRIKRHEMNTGYKPKGIKDSITFDASQEAGLHFFREKKNVLLDYEAGIGKTGTAYAAIMEAMHNYGAKKILVVTPSATRGDFVKQRQTFLEPEMQKLVRQSTANTSKAERRRRHLEQDGIHVVSHDSLRQDMSLLKDAGYDMVVVDEIHEVTAGTGQAGRFKALMELSEVPLKIGMSGTNIKNSKKELYRKIDFIDPEHTLGSMAEFEKRYKGLNQGTGIFQDAANDAFRKEIGQWTYTQKNQLPVENKVETIRVPLTPEQRKRYAASERQYREDRAAKKPGASAQRDSRNYAILANGDGEVGSNAKIEDFINKMNTRHSGEKAVLHVSRPGAPIKKAIATIKKRLTAEYGEGTVGVIDGDTGPGEMAKIKAAFNDPGNPMRFIIGSKSLESGHNLQKGGTVTAHMDIPDSKAAFDQRNARVFRKGQDKDTTTYMFAGTNPMDMRHEDLLETKAKEMSILGNPREVEAMDDTGFIGMLNKYEQEQTQGSAA